MKKDIDQAKADAIEAQKNMKNAIYKAGELESHSLVLQNMLKREKEEGTRIQKQTSAYGEQIRTLKKENLEKSLQAALAAGMAMDTKQGGGKGGKKGGKMGKLKDFDADDSTGTSKDLSAVRSSPSSPATPSSQSTVNKEFDEIRANYLKEIGKATNTFVETAPGSGSPRSKPHPDLGSPTGDHSEYEQLQGAFQKDVTQAENNFLDMMDKLEYGTTRPRTDLEAEARKLREQLEALRRQQFDINKWLENLTVELDDTQLKSGEYVMDVKDSKTNIKITSPDKTPEALARKKAEEEARKKREAEEAARRAAEEAKRRAAEEEARKKREAEEAAKRKRDEEEAARVAAEAAAKRKRDEEEAARLAAEAAAKKKRDEDEAARRAAEGKKAAGDASKSKGKEPATDSGDQFFTEEMQGTIKENIKEVLGHLEVISHTVQQKATASGTAESTAKDVLKKLDEPDQSK